MRAFSLLLAAVLTLAFTVLCAHGADARRGGGGGMRGGGMRGGSSSMRSMPSRPATRPSTPSSGFNFPKNDIASVGNRPSQLPSNGANRPGMGERPPGSIGNRPPLQPVRPVPPGWGWNGGYAWYPAPYYWGGGFWGFTTGLAFGYYYDEATHEQTESYQVQPDTPGAKALAAYGLTQTQCGQQNLVVIRGPENSVVCAQPNQTVAAGEYVLDVQNLTIASAS